MAGNVTVRYRDRILPLLLVGAGASTTVIALAGDFLTAGGLTGIGPRQFSLALSGVAILLAGVILNSPVNLRPVGEWLLVVLAAVVVSFAADLLVINGLPDFGAKHLVLGTIIFGLLLTAALPGSSIDRQLLGQWIKSAALDRQTVAQFLSVALQLGLLLLVIQQFQLENQAFYSNVMLLTFYGFLIHYFLPTRYRLSFFLLLSLAAVAGILGLANAAWVIGIGLGLIAICHLPIPYYARLALLLAAGSGLLVLRVGWVPAPGLDVIWPVLASMFMFRLIVYMYDVKHSKASPTVTTTLSYFFLLPNVVFPFFPVVDYSTFRRTYYDDDQHRIYQRGLQWMLRGVVQLILYRAINYYAVLAPAEVTNSAELVRYLISNFALYIRISGQFHLIIGLLHLFGFNLPTTHHLYFLASSFTDLWRRINIYWKDFMLKVFYYPTYFRIRQWGPMAGLGAATFFVFFLTWFFHAYQWLWLRGSFLFTAPDMLFWFILALLVVANTLYEAKRGRKRSLEQRGLRFNEIFAEALRSGGTFIVMAVLWALWSSDSIRDWLALFAVVKLTWASVGILLLAFSAIVVVFGLIIGMGARTESTTGARSKAPPSPFFKTAFVTGGALLLLVVVGNRAFYDRLGGQAQTVISDLTMNRLSSREAALLQQGYYEDLVGVDRFNSQLWDIYMKRPSDWPSIMETAAVRETGDNLIFELVPLTTMYFHGGPMSINRWGMRDRDYEQLPAPDTYRVALTGPSFVMGSGVADNEVFEWLLEDQLNREQVSATTANYEILNFAVPGYSAVQDLLVLEQKALAFQPDALFFMAHQREEEAVVLYLADRISVDADLPYADLMTMISGTGAEPGETKTEIERHLKPIQANLLSWTYQRIVAVSRANHIVPVWIFMPTLEDPVQAEEVAHLAGLAQAAGFVVLDLSDAYANQDLESLVVAYWDKHPNAAGHRLIADHLYEALVQHNAEIDLLR